MAFNELKGLSGDLFYKTAVDILSRYYKDAQWKIAQLLKGLDLTSFQRFRAEQMLRQIDAIVLSLNRETYLWANKYLLPSYNMGIDVAYDRLKAMGITRFVDYGATIHTSAVQVLINSVTLDLIKANDSIKYLFNSFIHQTQQSLLQDAEISRMIAEGLITGETRRTVSNEILKELQTQLGNEQFIVINGRNYQPKNYAELLARTRTREATSQGTINTCLRYGVDLVQWDVHTEICEYCQQYAGRVYSISGSDPNFPMLKENPPLHPNCKCILSPTTKITLEDRGYLDEIIKLSNSPLTEVPSFTRFEEIMAGI
jgi:hypothetical protein